MRRRYDGRSFRSVLASEVFARGTDPVSLQTAFAAIGVGTGGFGPVYDIACLEVLRQVVWDYQTLYELPDLDPTTGHPDNAGAEETSGALGSRTSSFAEFLANAAYRQSTAFFPDRQFDDMFRFGSLVSTLCVVGKEAETKIAVCVADKAPVPFDLAIVGVSSRAMQALGLDHDTPKNPFSTLGTHTQFSRPAVQSVQAGIHPAQHDQQLPDVRQDRASREDRWLAG